MNGDTKIHERMSVLNDLDRPGLRVAWIDAFGKAPPHHTSMMFMRKALIWDEQCRCYGGLSPSLKRALKAAADGRAANAPMAVVVKSGTQLIRDWNGKRYQVEVKEDGYLLADRHFKSLSAIALHITGTSWSGPRFFGLNSQSVVSR